MGKLTSTDWLAIKWYMKEFNYTIRDMMVWPTVRFRNNKNEIVDIGIFDIKTKYVARVKRSKKTGA